MSSPSTITIVQTISITTSLLASGGIAILSLFDIPLLKSQPASRSLPSIRWLFSRGSHLFPQAATISSAGFAYLAYASVPSGASMNLTSVLSHGRTVNGYLLAALMTLSIGPFTGLMVPTNFELIKINEKKGGKRSQKSEREDERKYQPGERSAEDSVAGKGEGGNELTDLSGPQEKTREATNEENERVLVLLRRFQLLNFIRAALIGVGGAVGLVTAL